MRNPVAVRPWLVSKEQMWKWTAGLILVLAVFFAYQPAWHAGFIWDDDDYLTNNPLLAAPDGLWRIWFSGDSLSQYFPLTYTVFRWEYTIWGLDPTGFHLVNILLHAVNSLLVWRLLRRLNLPGAWWAAAIFALHPIQVESVAWVSELKNLLMCFFLLSSLLCWVEFLQAGPKRRWRFYFVSLLLFALALFSKTTACTMPVVLLLIFWLRKEPLGIKRLMPVIPLFAMSLCMGILTMVWERNHIGTRGDMFSEGFPERLMIASHAVWFYLGKLLAPVNLMFSYPKWDISHGQLLTCGWLAGLVGLGILVCWLRRFLGRGPETAILFYVTTLGPLLGFIMLYTFRYTYVADHYQYVACIGPIALGAAGLSRLFKDQPAIKYLACAGLLSGLGAMTWQQARTYESAETLWRTTIDRNPGSWMAHGNLGCLLLKAGRVSEAIVCDQRAVLLNPHYSEGFNNLGVALVQNGQVDEAIEQYQRAIGFRPDDWEIYYNLGNALFQKGHLDEAVRCFQKAVEIQPAAAEAHCHLGNAFFQEGQLNRAIACYQRSLQENPVSVEAQNNLGSAFLRQGNWDSAIAHFQQALEINPREVETHNNLGDAFLQEQRFAEAAAQFRDALAIQPGYAPARSNLDLVQRRQGQ